MTTFGSRLAHLRRKRGLSQRQLADELCLVAGVATLTRNEISRWERGVRMPAQPWLGWLGVVLGTPLQPPAPRPAAVSSAGRWEALRPRLKVRPTVPIVSTHGTSG